MFQRTSMMNARIAVLGACGGIGQPLATLLKRNPLVSELNLCDVGNSAGVAADLSHICSPAKVTGFSKDSMDKCLDGCDIVVIPAGVPRKDGMTRQDLFNLNAGVIRDLVNQAAKSCPKARLCIITNPVNSTTPIAAETLKKAGVYDPTKLFGISTLDIVRSKTFVAGARNLNPFDINVNVVGGHSGPTIVPLLSQTGLNFTDEEIKALTKRIQTGGDEVVKAKAAGGGGSATLSMAYAGAEFTNSLLKAMRGDTGIIECSYVESNVEPEVTFFASRVELGKDGIKTIFPVGAISAYEEELKAAAIVELKKNIQAGIDFMQKA